MAIVPAFMMSDIIPSSNYCIRRCARWGRYEGWHAQGCDCPPQVTFSPTCGYNGNCSFQCCNIHPASFRHATRALLNREPPLPSTSRTPRLFLSLIVPAPDEYPPKLRRGLVPLKACAPPSHALLLPLAERDTAVRVVRPPLVARDVERKVAEALFGDEIRR